MNFFEAQEFSKKWYPDKLVTFELDEKCIRQIECIYTDSEMHMINHVEYNQVKVTPQGMESIYVPIQSHRQLITAAQIKSKVSKDSIYIHPDEIKTLNEMKSKVDPLLEMKLDELSLHSGISKDDIMKKMA